MRGQQNYSTYYAYTKQPKINNKIQKIGSRVFYCVYFKFLIQFGFGSFKLFTLFKITWQIIYNCVMAPCLFACRICLFAYALMNFRNILLPVNDFWFFSFFCLYFSYRLFICLYNSKKSKHFKIIYNNNKSQSKMINA